MNIFTRTIHRVILVLGIFFITDVPGYAADIDDSTVFMEAFTAFQLNDYLQTIDKCDQLNQVFPDSPLRDVTLILAARASFKSGDTERATKFMTIFTSEFPDSSLITSVEEELRVLASRQQKMQIFTIDRRTQNAARKVSTDRLAQ